MRKLAAAIVILSLALSATAFAKKGVGGTSVGQWSGGAHLGYSLGLGGWGGDAHPTVGLGAFGLYQIKKQWSIGGELYLQYTNIDNGDFTNLLFLTTYERKSSGGKSLLFLGGGGLYEDNFGLNGGLAYRKFTSQVVALMGGARFHIVFGDGTASWLHLFFCVQYFFGK